MNDFGVSENTDSLKDLTIRLVYESDASSLVDEFYVPVLSVAKKYDRLTGFFSSTCLAIAARGIAGLIQNRGHIRLLTSPYLTKKDVEAITGNNDYEIIEARMLESLNDISSVIESDYISALGWMLREGYIEIKLALVLNNAGNLVPAEEIESSGLFHQKVGIIWDKNGESISFSGSINETASGWSSNIEEFKVFRSWIDAEKYYHDSDVAKFERYWNNRSYRIKVLDAPSAVVKSLTKRSPIEKEDLAILKRELSKPRLCGSRKEMSLWPHQLTAVRKWLQANRCGMLEMATGTGKTLAALSCFCETVKEITPLVVIISAPYRHIGDQWRNNVRSLGLGIEVISADSTNPTWESDVTRENNRLLLGTKNKFIVITTHNTFSSERFIDMIGKISAEKLIIIDEVHGIGAPVRSEGLLEEYNMRLGLSATPRRWFDDEGTDRLIEYFNDVVYELPLSTALELKNPETGNPILVPYNYHPTFVELDEEELRDYRELTSRIGKSYHAARTDKDKSNVLSILLNKRAKIIRNARRKLGILEEIVTSLKKSGNLDKALIYVSPEQIDSVSSLLNRYEIKQHKFTQAESAVPDENGISERSRLLKGLENGYYQVLIGIRCLDEGVDVPCVDKAIILSSTGNPRQYIQRRGRILRFTEGKQNADIYDIIVMPKLSSDALSREVEMKIIRKETRRYEEFAGLALNRDECMRKIADAEIDAGLFGNIRL